MSFASLPVAAPGAGPVGAGLSAMNAAFDLIELAQAGPGTRILWAFQQSLAAAGSGGGGTGGLALHGEPGAGAQALMGPGAVTALASFLIDGGAGQDSTFGVTDRAEAHGATPPSECRAPGPATLA